MKRVLVTGVKGFTGRYVAAELAAHGWEVWGTGAHEAVGDARYRRADLVDAASLRRVVEEVRPDAVVHLAALAFVGHGDADAFYRVNLIGTRNLLSVLAPAEQPPECVLLASSANVYGNANEGVLRESTPPSPANDYAVSKLAMENMARLWMDRLPIVIARPFNYTGVGQADSFLLPKIVAHFQRRAEVIELGNLDVSRDFSDVRAVASAYRRLLEVCPVGETVNVCSGRTHSLREALAMAEAITGQSMRVEVNPAFVRANEVRRLGGDPAKLRKLIGEWDSPPLEETLRWMLEGASV
ncbi:GDP-mannose 4,6-dehydratase [Azoarcus sp. DN11]|uniref:GDP-mannose 4,6-dehydratase n=1 Tax=Azoarcus sp. DN11 TaxID=356837 RepID=UPI000EAE41D0|nr:GDP-mannose 4,6-dehydratase [Azoarcus sp. DN11]AYH45323.1 GDP-mannose 4,6 dehydratase [Azoarcus sp. DN11]